MILDLTQNEDKLRLRVGDYNEPLLLPTSVYTTTLQENDNNLSRSATAIATYLLAIFAQQTHEKLNYIEIWGDSTYQNYKDFLFNVLKNPRLSQSAPIPYTGAASTTDKNPLIQFTEDWNVAFIYPNQTEDLYNITHKQGSGDIWVG